MNLFFQATSLCIDKNDPNIVFAGVGPSICIIKDQKILKSQSLFEHHMRILAIQQYSDCYFAYAENILLKLLFSYQTLEFSIQNRYELPDILKAIDFTEENNETKAILGHGQIINIKNDNSIEIRNPPNWKTVTSASIKDNQLFYGDSFGTLTYVDNFNFDTPYGTLFCITQNIDQKTNLRQILTAHEYKAAALWNIQNNSLECIWECKDFPSRVWGCNFFKGDPIVFSEDACVHYKNQIYQLHRSKTITALAIHDDTIVTAGQYGTIRFSNFSNTDITPQVFDMKNKQLIATSFNDGTCLVGTFEGNLLLLPNNEIIYNENENNNNNTENEDNHKKGWFLISSYNTTALCFSRDKKLLFYDKSQKEAKKFTFKKLNTTAVSISLYGDTGAVILVTNCVQLFKLPSLEEIATYDLSDDFPSPPTTVTVTKFKEHTITAIGSLANVLLIEFDSKNQIVCKTIVDTSTNDDFISLHFTKNLTLFCGGKSNGVISIIEKVENNGQINGWRLKTHWRVPWQLRNIIQIGGYDTSPIVSVLTKDSIVMWDILTQTNICKFSFSGKKNRVSIQVNDESFTAACCDGQKVILFSNSPCLSTKFVGPQFHGLRILSSTSTSKNNIKNFFSENKNDIFNDDNLLVTGSCDRDIRLWKVDSNGFELLDCVYGSTDGTHSLCFGRINDSNSMIVFSGGAKKILIAWEIVNKRLFLLKEFVLDQFGINTKVNFTVNCCTLVTIEKETFLYLGSSDGYLNIFKYDFNKSPKHIDLIERKELKGTPMSIDSCDTNVVVAESTGDLYIISIKNGTVKSDEVNISDCGVMMVRLFGISLSNGEIKYIAASSCDDGRLILTDVENRTELLKIKGNHTGGIRSLAVGVNKPDGDQSIIISIASFSYDQCCVIHKISFPDLQIIRVLKFDTSVFDGERVEFVQNNVVALGSGMEMFSML